jgi:predicted molibdopterin-dependent oxidoreductase YjgC
MRRPSRPSESEVVIEVDDRPVPMRPSDTLASGLLRAGRLTIRASKRGEPRGIYCAIGVCNECLVTVDGVPNVRACMTPVRTGLRVRSQGHLRDEETPG